MVGTGSSSATSFSLSSTCYAKDYGDAQTGAVFLTPASSKKLVIKQVYASTSTVNVDVTLNFATSSKTIFKLYTAQKATATGNIICGEGGIDEALSVTCGDHTFISVAYDEID